MKKYALAILTCWAVVMVSSGISQTKKVTLKNGSVIVGQVKEIEDGYEFSREEGGLTITIAKDQVDTIEDVKSLEGQYEDKLKQLKDEKRQDDPEARYELALWAYNNEKLEIARKNLKETLRLDPRHEKAKLLLRVVESKIKGKKDDDDDDDDVDRKISPKILVTMEDIYKIRIEEVAAGERVAVVFKNDVVGRFVDIMLKRGEFDRNEAKEFQQLPGFRKLSIILKNISPTNYGIKDDIILKTDPQVMNDFRRKVWPIVSNGCASLECHGSAGGQGNLKLYNVPGADVRALYTNFVLMNSCSAKGHQLIDRDNVEYSLLLQHGLPPRHARTEHPEEITPLFTGMKDARYVTIKKWIESLAGPPAPDYRLRYKPTSATRPADSSKRTGAGTGRR